MRSVTPDLHAEMHTEIHTEMHIEMPTETHTAMHISARCHPPAPPPLGAPEEGPRRRHACPVTVREPQVAEGRRGGFAMFRHIQCRPVVTSTVSHVSVPDIR